MSDMERAKQVRLYECLMRLKHGPEFEPFRTHLHEQWAAEHARLEKESKSEVFLRVQGRAQAYSELKDLVERAPELLEKMKEVPSSRP